MRVFHCGPWQMPDSVILILSLSKDAQQHCSAQRALPTRPGTS
jgi:hypothetical protein